MKRIDCSFMGISGECFIHITLEFENIPRKGDKVVLSRNIAEYVRENMTNDVENAEEYADIISMSLIRQKLRDYVLLCSRSNSLSKN